MCVVKTPKVSKQAAEEKPVQVFTNRYFVDRGADAVAARVGRNSLRIDRAANTPSAPPAAILPPNNPANPITVGVQNGGRTGPQAPTIGGGGRRSVGGSYRSLMVER